MSSRDERNEERITVLMPVYEDWEAASVVCRELDTCFAGLPRIRARILLVDDGSREGMKGWEDFTPQNIESLAVLCLTRNLGHQRAIAVGLCHIYESALSDRVLVMDADGEDRPADAVRLLDYAHDEKVVFAARRKRLEGYVFRAGYALYRHLHRMLTGVPVRIGNFSVLPSRSLARLVSMSELWNHYAGTVLRASVGYESVPIDRGRRYRGKSHMNLISLVNHGLAGIASFQDVVATRLLMMTGAGVLVIGVALLIVIYIRLFTQLAIPGWATYAVGLLMVMFVQLLATAFTLVFTIVTARANLLFIPIRDYRAFVADTRILWNTPNAREPVTLRR